MENFHGKREFASWQYKQGDKFCFNAYMHLPTVANTSYFTGPQTCYNYQQFDDAPHCLILNFSLFNSSNILDCQSLHISVSLARLGPNVISRCQFYKITIWENMWGSEYW